MGQPRVIEPLAQDIQDALGTVIGSAVVGKSRCQHFVSQSGSLAEHGHQSFGEVLQFDPALAERTGTIETYIPTASGATRWN